MCKARSRAVPSTVSAGASEDRRVHLSPLCHNKRSCRSAKTPTSASRKPLSGCCFGLRSDSEWISVGGFLIRRVTWLTWQTEKSENLDFIACSFKKHLNG
ncbi:hypothetical protein DPEC_G00188460 [Dallia pectoralis]|uniref:Uncharacterized protein n=1 Tax=Dallia pectoralis TaxID=75939 RepID=A0ACC2GC34_DALPE|nr:hypothetical protein DPEC_G00188460 [Dallia pectoralis]